MTNFINFKKDSISEFMKMSEGIYSNTTINDILVLNDSELILLSSKQGPYYTNNSGAFFETNNNGLIKLNAIAGIQLSNKSIIISIDSAGLFKSNPPLNIKMIDGSKWILKNNYLEQAYETKSINLIKLNETSDTIYTKTIEGSIWSWNISNGNLISKSIFLYPNSDINSYKKEVAFSQITKDNKLHISNYTNDSLLYSIIIEKPTILGGYDPIKFATTEIKCQYSRNNNVLVGIGDSYYDNQHYHGYWQTGTLDIISPKNGKIIYNLNQNIHTNNFIISDNEKEFTYSGFSKTLVEKSGINETLIINEYVDSNNIHKSFLNFDGSLVKEEIFNLQFSPNGKYISGLIGNKYLIWQLENMKPIYSFDNLKLSNLTFTSNSQRFLVFNDNVLQIRNIQGDLIKDSIFVKNGYINNVISKIVRTNKFLIGGNDGIMRLFEEELINKDLTALFKIDSVKYLTNKPVKFIDLSIGKIKNWKWDFGDGDSSNDLIPSHIYTKAGLYDVRLIVSDGTYSDTLIKKAYIKVILALQAGFEITNNIGITPFKVDFKNVSTGEITSYKWYFGDGDSSNVASPSHTYTKGGNFTVSLIVSDGISSSTYTKEKFISVSDNLSVEGGPAKEEIPPFSPNPVKDKLHLKTNEFNDSELIQILDMNGRKILETELKETIDVSNLTKGVYFLKIGNKEWKFLKE